MKAINESVGWQTAYYSIQCGIDSPIGYITLSRTSNLTNEEWLREVKEAMDKAYQTCCDEIVHWAKQ